MHSMGGLQVLEVAEIAHTILLHLDHHCVDMLLESIYGYSSLRDIFHDQSLWKQLLRVHFDGPVPEQIRSFSFPKQVRGWQWTENASSCPNLQDFLRSVDELDKFTSCVTILQGDIGRIQDINGKPLDAIAFPRRFQYRSDQIRETLAMFQRGGPELVELVQYPFFRKCQEGECVVTPAFNAKVQKLIHCPQIVHPTAYDALIRTYEKLMEVIVKEHLTCVALTPIATHHMAPNQSAQIALRTLQSLIRANHGKWEGSLAVVCYDKVRFEAFTRQKQRVMQSFNALPPYEAELAFEQPVNLWE